MKCPDCGTAYVCPCEHCAKTFSKGKIAWISHGDEESCPVCGLRKHLEQWLDVNFKQFKELENEPR